jgi:iron complex outermembrane receptor protein
LYNPLNALKGLQIFPPFLNVPNAVEPARTSDGNLSFTARLAYDLSRQINLYGSISTGFKASSINLSRDSRPALADAAAIAAGGLASNNLRYVRGGGRFARPEKSLVYELGMKANWGVAQVNLAAFYQQIKDFQSNVFTGLGFDLLNADKESVYGFEFEGTVKPTDELTISEAVTYLKPRYDSYMNSSFGDISGRTPAGITPLSSTFVVTWDHPFGDGQHVIMRADWHYEAPVQNQDGMPGFNSTNADGTPNYSTGLAAGRLFRREVSEFDASLTWALNRRIEFSLWGRNLTDNRYITTVFDSPAQQGSISGYVNQPRTYGISALAKF